MRIEDVLELVRSLNGSLILAPVPGSGYPEIAWGDYFCYYSADGTVPSTRQPYATIITKDYPDDAGSRLDEPGRWRLNVRVGRDRLGELLAGPAAAGATVDFGATDVLVPHPVYARQGWIAVVLPAYRTEETVRGLLRDAHRLAEVDAHRHAEEQADPT
ncbi:DUF6194 family protein [Skermania piniformis]|uniref:DUF6194 domain-containing protein n=1 Tax=Skermania pinensis TaxID=39122 RepID=A0ABX8SB12_9ACTN|nr:DUF6194 family protein [Skermania piniformis]QXQ15044.1 hypothetical protein KV203_06730 [Skermania piniformis]